MNKLAEKTNRELLLNGEDLTPSAIYEAVKGNIQISINKEIEQKILRSHEFLNRLIDNNRIIYGVNTSFGGFVHWLVPHKHAEKLQNNLISSVATNVGPFFKDDVVKASMLSRLNALARGVSGISLENFNKLLEMYNKGIVPCIPSKGSLGASGDLGPLACIALVGVGKWKAKINGEILSGKLALQKAGIEPMKLGYKEGLSLINGTSAMTGFAAILIEEAINLVKSYEIISCLTFEGLKVKKQAFNPIVHHQKKHHGQLRTSENIWALLHDSKSVVNEIEIEEELRKLQMSTPIATHFPIEDAYSIRCTPQILGPIKDNLCSIEDTIQNEINSSSDNPLIIPEDNEVFHNGHFHGQYISMAMDQLSISLTTLSNLADRRIDRFMDKNNSNNLPAFLCDENPGLRLGLMGGQFMATSITAENRSLCNPISIHTLTSTGDFQDNVSLGLVAARRAREIFDNTSYVIAFELLCAAQAIDIRREVKKLSTATLCVYKCVRKLVPYLKEDQSLTEYIEKLAEMIKLGMLLEEVERNTGKTIL